jgi:hypothetical protein
VGDVLLAGHVGLRHGPLSIGQIGAPVTRSNTKRKPCFVGLRHDVAASTIWRMVRSLGATGRS